MINDGVTTNPSLYKRLSKPFASESAFGEAFERFFRAVSAVREACGLPDVVLIVAAKCRPDAERRVSIGTFGDSSLVIALLLHALRARGAQTDVVSQSEFEALAKERETKAEPQTEEAAPAAGGAS